MLFLAAHQGVEPIIRFTCANRKLYITRKQSLISYGGSSGLREHVLRPLNGI